MGLRAETTLYVGKHFEVRDHDQPTKYVFSGSTRVAHITGSLSTNTRIQRFRLRPGWNVLSLAVSAPNALRQLTNSQSVVRWDQTTLTWLPISTDETLPAGTILWLNATTNATVAVVGAYSDPVNRQIAAGTTYLATTGLEAWSPNFPLTLAAWSFDSQPPVRRSFSGGGSSFNLQPTWLARLTGDLSSINELPRTFAPGHALYVIANAPYELEVPDPALRIRYYHQDHLGSSSVMTDANGALVEETTFYPFGIPRHEHRLRPIEEDYKFTQKERDRESGLHYFEARYLTAGLARFVVPDPKYAHPDTLVEADAEGFVSNPQKMNLYAYARNNPLNHVDPTGLDEEAKEMTVCKTEKRNLELINQDLDRLDHAYIRKSEECKSTKTGSAAQEDCKILRLALIVARAQFAETQNHMVQYLEECIRKERDKPPPSAGSPPSASPLPTLPPQYNPITRVTRIIIFAIPVPGPPPSPNPSPNPSPPLTKLYNPVTREMRQWVPNLILVEP